MISLKTPFLGDSFDILRYKIGHLFTEKLQWTSWWPWNLFIDDYGSCEPCELWTGPLLFRGLSIIVVQYTYKMSWMRQRYLI